MENKVKVGDKIWITASPWSRAPAGTICTVRRNDCDGNVTASIDGSDDGFTWRFLADEYEIIDDVLKPWRDMTMGNKVKAGDKIKVVEDVWSVAPVGSICTVQETQGAGSVTASVDGGNDDFAWFFAAHEYARVDDAPKLWRDMTPEEKGALLLARHEGKVIECYQWHKYGWAKIDEPHWDGDTAYRVRPEPKRKTVNLFYGGTEHHLTHIGSIDLIDGKPDPNSIRMEEIE